MSSKQMKLVVCFFFLFLFSENVFVLCRKDSATDNEKLLAEEKELNILKLTYDNYEKTTDSEDLFLIYEGDNCEVCKVHRPLFVQVAKYVKENFNYTIATLDIDLYTKLHNRLDAKSKGIIRMIKKGNSPGYPFFGVANFESMLTWFNKFNVDSLGTSVSTANEVKSHFGDKFSIFYIGKRESMAFETFEDLLKSTYEVEFGICDKVDCARDLNVDAGSLVFIKNNEVADFLKPNYDLKSAAKFLSLNTLDIVSDDSPQVLSKLRLLELPTVIIYKKKGEERNSYVDLLTKVLKDRKEKGLFQVHAIVTEISDKQSDLQNIFKFRESHLPTVALLEFVSQGNKFKISENALITFESVSEFIRDWENHKLSPYLYSEEIPENPVEEGIVKVVGENFENVVINNNKDVLLFVHVPWCGYCRQFAPIFESFRRKHKNHKKLVLAKLDASVNQVSEKYFNPRSGYPLVILYKGNDKKNPKEFIEDRQIYLLQKFLEKNGAYVYSHASDEL